MFENCPILLKKNIRFAINNNYVYNLHKKLSTKIMIGILIKHLIIFYNENV